MTRLLSSARTRFVVVTALGLGFALLALHGRWFRAVDLKVYDIGLSVRPERALPSDVVVVALDKYSRQKAIAPPEFPISAHIREHARVIDRLTAAGARVVALDILFDQMAADLDVQPLATSLEQSGRVCAAGAIERQTLAQRSDGSAITEERLVVPISRLGDGLCCIGLVNMPLDADGVARRGSYGRAFQGRWVPSMPSILAVAARGEGIGTSPDLEAALDVDRSVARVGDSTFYIDYRSAKSGITIIPYADVLLSDGWQSQVRDRVVLVGVTEYGLSDIYQSPVAGLFGSGPDERLPGALVLAYAAQTLISRSLVWPLARPYAVSLCIGLALAASAAALGKRIFASGGLVLALIVAILAVGVLMSALRVTLLPAGVAAGVTLFTGVVGLLVGYVQTRVAAQLQQRELAEITDDLKKAAQIQQSLQPASMPVVQGVRLSGFQIACKEIGGDYYDVLDLGAGRVGLIIADVCGKGISAALLMSNLQSKVRQLAPAADSACKVVEALNRASVRVFTEGRFVTLIYAILDPGKKEFSYCSAGHMPPIRCRAGGEVGDLPQGGIPVGILPDFAWRDETVRLEPGDVLFMYTDGLSEAKAEKTEDLYGEDRIKAYLAANRDKNPEELNLGIVDAARGFSGSEHLADDITVLTLKMDVGLDLAP